MSNSDPVHVYPLNDSAAHDLEGVECACHPRVICDESSVVVVHNAFDGRELDEAMAEKYGAIKV